MKNRILTLVAVVATAGLIMAWGCGGKALEGPGTVGVTGESVPVDIELAFVTGDVGSTTPVTKDLIDDCNLGLDGEGSGSPENITTVCNMAAVGSATVPGGLVPIVAITKIGGIYETPTEACVRVGESPSNCITWLKSGTAGNCYILFSGYTYAHSLINSEFIPISMSANFTFSWGPAINLETAAIGVKGDQINLTAVPFNELYTALATEVPTPDIDWSGCAGILDNATDPFDGTDYENMVDAINLKYIQSATILSPSKSCTVAVAHTAQISLNGITSGSIDFYRDPFKVSGYIVDDIANPKVGLDGFYSAANFTFKDSAGNALIEGGTNDPTLLEIVAGANMEFSSSQIFTSNIHFVTDIGAVKPIPTFDYVEPVSTFDVKISPNDAWKTEFSVNTYTFDNMVVYDTVNFLSLQQDVPATLHAVSPAAVASEFYKATLDSTMAAFTRPAITHDAVPPTTVLDEWIDNVGQSDLVATLAHDAANNLYTFADATNVAALYQADRWTKETVTTNAGVGYLATMTLDLANVVDIITNNDAEDYEFSNRDLVWMSVTVPGVNLNDAGYVLFVMGENGITKCGAMSMEYIEYDPLGDPGVLKLVPTSGAYVDCSLDSSPIVKFSGGQAGVGAYYNGLEITEANNGHELRDWDGDGGVTEDLALKGITGFGGATYMLNLIIASEPPLNMAFDINGFYNGGFSKVGQIASPAEMFMN